MVPLQALGRGHIQRQRNRDEAERQRLADAERLRRAVEAMVQGRCARQIQRSWKRWTVVKAEWWVPPPHAASLTPY